MNCLDSFPLIHISETDSTNNYLSALCDRQEVEGFTTVLTDFQTAGKGQRGNSWESDNGKNLLFSYVLFPDFLEANRQFLISQIASLSIKEELDTYTDNISIKWPNDIYWKEKKICGILIENDLTGIHISRSIIGIGVNINQEMFRSNAPNPVSLFQITGQRNELLPILSNIMQRVQTYFQELEAGHAQVIADKYMNALFRKEGMHKYSDDNGEFFAQIERVAPEGFLILKDEGGNERKYAFKEVQYRL